MLLSNKNEPKPPIPIRNPGTTKKILLSDIRNGRTPPAILVPGLAFLILKEGWDTAAMVCGVSILLLVTPMTLWIQNTPEAQGLLPDGSDVSRKSILEEPTIPGYIVTGYDLSGAFHTVSYWLLFVGSICRLTSKGGFMVQYQLH